MSATMRKRTYALDPNGLGDWRITGHLSAGRVRLESGSLLDDTGRPVTLTAPMSALIATGDGRTALADPVAAAGGEARHTQTGPTPAAIPAPEVSAERKQVGGPPPLPPPPGQPNARTTDPQTAHDAADSIDEQARRNAHTAILRALFEHGPQTDWQLGQRLGLIATSAGKRRGELRDMGLVCDSGHRGPTETGPKKAVRWALTAAGEVAA